MLEGLVGMIFCKNCFFLSNDDEEELAQLEEVVPDSVRKWLASTFATQDQVDSWPPSSPVWTGRKLPFDFVRPRPGKRLASNSAPQDQVEGWPPTQPLRTRQMASLHLNLSGPSRWLSATFAFQD